MENKAIKISSITKKLVVALLGAFLLFFLLFHMLANLCILREDGGAWYSAFCHFMTNPFVKVMEVVLMASIVLHIILTVYLWITNQKARPVKYHQPHKSKTGAGSKLTIITGVLIIACLFLHFMDFYFVKLGFVEGAYMVKTEKFEQSMGTIQDSPKIQNAMQIVMNSGIQSEEDYRAFAEYVKSIPDPQDEELDLVDYFNFEEAIMNMEQDGRLEQGSEYIRQITYKEKEAIEAIVDIDLEPDFYYMTRDKFSDPVISLLYLLFFGILWFHMIHAFEAAFQTLGLTNYKYNKAIQIIGFLYACGICGGFALVPIWVLLFV